MNGRLILLAAGVGVLITGCTVLPEGPRVMVLPGSGKDLEQFQKDDAACRRYAATWIDGKASNQAATKTVEEHVVTGTVVGAAAGAAIGGSQGAGIGAASGLLVGSATGSDAGYLAARNLQNRYDGAYIQCMYAMGNRVPISGRLADAPVAKQNLPLSPDSRSTIPPDFYPLPPADYKRPPPPPES